MTVDRETLRDEGPSRPEPGDPVSTATVVAYTVAAVALVGWFLFGWLVLRQGFVDSVGESAGAAFALLLAAAIVGTFRRNRDG